ncbi:MAG: hypothetical protein ACPGUD_05630 [Parashewanella sp.]
MIENPTEIDVFDLLKKYPDSITPTDKTYVYDCCLPIGDRGGQHYKITCTADKSPSDLIPFKAQFVEKVSELNASVFEYVADKVVKPKDHSQCIFDALLRFTDPHFLKSTSLDQNTVKFKDAASKEEPSDTFVAIDVDLSNASDASQALITSEMEPSAEVKGLVETAELTPFGLKKVEDAARDGYWFFEPNNKCIAVFQDAAWAMDWGVLSHATLAKVGGRMEVSMANEHFVQLNVRWKRDKFTAKEAQANLAICRAVHEYDAFVPAVIIDPFTVLTPQAGLELHADILAIRCFSSVKVHQFKKLCEQLAQLHEKGIFHRDISTYNITLKTISSPCQLIDLKDMAIPELDNYNKYRGTRRFMPESLAVSAINGDFQVLKSKDEYSLLISMLMATAGKEVLDASIDKDEAGNGFYANVIFRSKAAMTAINCWIIDNVRKDYRSNVHDFLLAPHQKGLPVPLYKTIIWEADPGTQDAGKSLEFDYDHFNKP